MTGILIKKENFATSLGFARVSVPATIVEPLREMPGKSATACMSPMGTAFFQPSSRGFFVRSATNSQISSSAAVTEKKIASTNSAFSP